MSTQISEPTAEQVRCAEDARRRNEQSYETTVNVLDLPSAHVAYQATPEAVHVFATDMNVLADWLYQMGGTVTTVDLPSGQTVWTLHMTTWTDSPRFPAVPVHVSVVQVSGVPVMHEIASAVAR